MEIEQMIRDYVDRNVLFGEGGIEYDNESSFLAAGILDSMAVLELVSWIEAAFGIKVDIRDVTPENFDSVSRLAAFLRRSITQPAAAAGNGRL
jgi:acyl carrier protein